jgi:plasmid stabilization system protein ParE
MAKKIIWSNLAKLELANVLDFYVQQNGNSNYSLKLLDEIDDVVKTLSESELIGRLTKNKITRVFPIDVFLLFYEIKKDTVEVVSFWDNRQNEVKRKVK